MMAVPTLHKYVGGSVGGVGSSGAAGAVPGTSASAGGAAAGGAGGNTSLPPLINADLKILLKDLTSSGDLC